MVLGGTGADGRQGLDRRLGHRRAHPGRHQQRPGAAAGRRLLGADHPGPDPDRGDPAQRQALRPRHPGRRAEPRDRQASETGGDRRDRPGARARGRPRDHPQPRAPAQRRARRGGHPAPLAASTPTSFADAPGHRGDALGPAPGPLRQPGQPGPRRRRRGLRRARPLRRARRPAPWSRPPAGGSAATWPGSAGSRERTGVARGRRHRLLPGGLPPGRPAGPRASTGSTERILTDLRDGEDGVRPGIIGEIGVSADFTPAEQVSLRGALAAQVETGLPVQVHLPGWFRLAGRGPRPRREHRRRPHQGRPVPHGPVRRRPRLPARGDATAAPGSSTT